MKLSDMIISAVLKRGILNEVRNMECDVEIPDTKIKVKVKIEHMTLKFEKEA